MKYTNQEWSIEKLLHVHDDDKALRLDPPYQRNPIWSLRAQQSLIDTILSGQPIPNFFFLLGKDRIYEVVDGQQRIRTILGYWKNLIPDLHGQTLEQRIQSAPKERKHLTDQLLKYLLSICVITELSAEEHIELYYAKVNRTGLRLNRPELKKAEYFTTNFLRLLQELTNLPELTALRLFSSLTSMRLNDLDYVSELVALIKYGLSDKKDKVDELYEDDIDDDEYNNLRERFAGVVSFLNRLDRIKPLIRTRYKQKNDFYTLFFFLLRHRAEPPEVLEYFYQVLVKIGPFIRPSQEDCPPLMQYALHCVTQSNSKTARQARYDFMVQVLMNTGDTPNDTQAQIIQFFEIAEPPLRRVGHYHTLNCETLKYPEQVELSLQ